MMITIIIIIIIINFFKRESYSLWLSPLKANHVEALLQYPSTPPFDSSHASSARPSSKSRIKTKIRIGHWRNGTDRDTSKCSGKNMSQCHLGPTTDLSRNAPGTNARFGGDCPAINCLNNATALHIINKCSIPTSQETYSVFIIKTNC